MKGDDYWLELERMHSRDEKNKERRICREKAYKTKIRERGGKIEKRELKEREITSGWSFEGRLIEGKNERAGCI